MEEDVGTVWKARVTSWMDILEGALGKDGGGVSPSSDLTSCKVKGNAVKSSAIPSSELTGCSPALLEVCDQTAFRCSGSGARAGDSFALKLIDDLVQEADAWCVGGVTRTRSGCFNKVSHRDAI